MNNAPNIHREDLSSSTEVRAEVLFVDLDETLLDGTISELSDEELGEANIIQTTMNLIKKAKNLGIPVVMVSRNKPGPIDRFFRFKPELRPLFDDIMPCQGDKSHLINCYLSQHGITPENSLFVDDNPNEIDDVKSLGVKTIYPHNTAGIILDKPKMTEEKVTDLTRYKAKKTLDFLQADNVALSA